MKMDESNEDGTVKAIFFFVGIIAIFVIITSLIGYVVGKFIGSNEFLGWYPVIIASIALFFTYAYVFYNIIPVKEDRIKTTIVDEGFGIDITVICSKHSSKREPIAILADGFEVATVYGSKTVKMRLCSDIEVLEASNLDRKSEPIIISGERNLELITWVDPSQAMPMLLDVSKDGKAIDAHNKENRLSWIFQLLAPWVIAVTSWFWIAASLNCIVGFLGPIS